MQNLADKIEELPDELKREVNDFVDYLISRHKTQAKKAKLDWIGGLKEFKNKFSSVELQHMSSQW